MTCIWRTDVLPQVFGLQTCDRMPESCERCLTYFACVVNAEINKNNPVCDDMSDYCHGMCQGYLGCIGGRDDPDGDGHPGATSPSPPQPPPVTPPPSPLLPPPPFPPPPSPPPPPLPPPPPPMPSPAPGPPIDLATAETIAFDFTIAGEIGDLLGRQESLEARFAEEFELPVSRVKITFTLASIKVHVALLADAGTGGAMMTRLMTTGVLKDAGALASFMGEHIQAWTPPALVVPPPAPSDTTTIVIAVVTSAAVVTAAILILASALMCRRKTISSAPRSAPRVLEMQLPSANGTRACQVDPMSSGPISTVSNGAMSSAAAVQAQPVQVHVHQSATQTAQKEARPLAENPPDNSVVMEDRI